MAKLKNLRAVAVVMSLGATAFCYSNDICAQPNVVAPAKGIKRANMDTPFQCIDGMINDFLMAGISADVFTHKWQGEGGRRRQQNERDFSNINPCPQFFTNVLLFVPITTGDGGSLEFQFQRGINLTLSDLIAHFGTNRQAVNAASAEFFQLSRPEHDYDATIIAFFEGNPTLTSKPVVLTIQREER